MSEGASDVERVVTESVAGHVVLEIHTGDQTERYRVEPEHARPIERGIRQARQDAELEREWQRAESGGEAGV